MFVYFSSVQFSSIQSLSRVRLFATPWIAAHQASLSITNSQNSLKLMSIESVMPSSHLILGRPLLLLPPIPPSIRVFSNESTLHMRWPKYWSFIASSNYFNAPSFMESEHQSSLTMSLIHSLCSVAQSCPTLCDPWDWSPPNSSVHEIFQARVLEWGAIAFSEHIVSNSKYLLLLLLLLVRLTTECWSF